MFFMNSGKNITKLHGKSKFEIINYHERSPSKG